MFTKLSAALVAISLVAVAQPGLAQISAIKQSQQTINVQNEYSTGTIGNGAGGVFGGRAGVKFTDERVYYFGGNTTTINADVTVDGVAVALSTLKPGMVCNVTTLNAEKGRPSTKPAVTKLACSSK